MPVKRKHAAVSAEMGDRLVLAFDFGTTYSGVAYAWCNGTKAEGSIEVLSKWPGGDNTTSLKVPTQIAYVRRGVVRDIKWGFQLKSREEGLKYFKLLLQTGQVFPEESYPTELTHALKYLDKSAEDVATDFFAQLLRSSNNQLCQLFDGYSTREVPVTYILTVPAMWSDAAKDATKRVARNAGFPDDLILITEPEAAAQWVLTRRTDYQTEVGDCFTVCDAGGGTVDLITYEIVKKNPLKFREVVPGKGGICGSTALDLRFKEHVKNRITPEEWTYIRHTNPNIWACALAYFDDQVKRRFDANPDSDDEGPPDFIPMSGVAKTETNGFIDGFMVLCKNQVIEIFDGPVSEIYSLIKSQINAAEKTGKRPRAVILVGGFGDSPYLYTKIVEALQEDMDLVSGPEINVIRSSDALTAVVRGAVLSGLPKRAEVTSRKSPYHYGVRCSRPFDPLLHLQADRYWDDIDEAYRATNQMSWFIHKGQTMMNNQPIPLNFNQNSKNAPDDLVSKLHYSECDEAPTRFDESTVRPLCRCKVDASATPKNAWKPRVNPSGIKYQQIAYELTLKKSSAMLDFAIRINGRIYNRVQATFGYK